VLRYSALPFKIHHKGRLLLTWYLSQKVSSVLRLW